MQGYVLKELRLLDHRRRPACPGRPWWHTRRLHLSSTLTDPFILTWSYVATLCLSQVSYHRRQDNAEKLKVLVSQENSGSAQQRPLDITRIQTLTLGPSFQNMPRSNITSWRDKATVLPCASSPFAFSK